MTEIILWLVGVYLGTGLIIGLIATGYNVYIAARLGLSVTFTPSNTIIPLVFWPVLLVLLFKK